MSTRLLRQTGTDVNRRVADLSEDLQDTYDVLVQCDGDLGSTSKILGVTRSVLRSRITSLGVPLEHFQTQPSAKKNARNEDEMNTANAKTDAKTDKKRHRPKQGEKPKSEKYSREDGDILVQDGQTRRIKVGEQHPAAQAKVITEELGGTATPTATGLKLKDKEGRYFACVASIGKTRCNIYVVRVDLKVAKETASNLGDWDFCWPKKKVGHATLMRVDQVSKGLIRSVMRLHALNAVDHRKKGSDAKEATKDKKVAA